MSKNMTHYVFMALFLKLPFTDLVCLSLYTHTNTHTSVFTCSEFAVYTRPQKELVVIQSLPETTGIRSTVSQHPKAPQGYLHILDVQIWS